MKFIEVKVKSTRYEVESHGATNPVNYDFPGTGTVRVLQTDNYFGTLVQDESSQIYFIGSNGNVFELGYAWSDLGNLLRIISWKHPRSL